MYHNFGSYLRHKLLNDDKKSILNKYFLLKNKLLQFLWQIKKVKRRTAYIIYKTNKTSYFTI